MIDNVETIIKIIRRTDGQTDRQMDGQNQLLNPHCMG